MADERRSWMQPPRYNEDRFDPDDVAPEQYVEPGVRDEPPAPRPGRRPPTRLVGERPSDQYRVPPRDEDFGDEPGRPWRKEFASKDDEPIDYGRGPHDEDFGGEDDE